jgi:ribosomal protein S18 acetylase RimI-like enzyme
MMSHVTPLRAEHLAALFSLYRSQTDGLAHCLLPSEARFVDDMNRPEVGQVLVAEEAGQARGFAALRPLKDDEDLDADVITALFFANDDHGAALLEACARRARPGPLLAFPQSHGHAPVQGYNAGWDGLSDRLSLQARVLARHGFTPYDRELLLACSIPAVAAPAELPGFAIDAGLGERGGFRQRAWLGEERVGLCLYATAEGASDDPSGPQIGYINWLWTAEASRRRGVAQTLMLRALAHLRSLGCAECWLSTGTENWAAQRLYLALGFAVVDATSSWKRA